MAHLVFILVALALLAGFFALAQYEARRGARVFARARERLDQKVAHAEFILSHVDFAAFAREEAFHAAHHIGHAVAHISLQAVRTAERGLTRLVRRFRTTHDVAAAPRESARPFVQTLSDFKDRLKASRPKTSDAQQNKL